MHKQRGFSLIEIMVVVVILGILAALVVPKIVRRPDEARLVKARQDVLSIQNALELYRLDNAIYPTNEQGISALVKKPSQSPVPEDWQQYLKTLPKDPWGNLYQYANPGQHGDVDVFTYNQHGEENEHTVIGNWDEE